MNVCKRLTFEVVELVELEGYLKTSSKDVPSSFVVSMKP
jgi:hypothetical protein